MDYNYIEDIKVLLGITGTYHDAALKAYAAEAVEYMVDAGVDRSIAESRECVGTVARGVSDLWNLSSGGTQLSPYFRERVIQLAYRGDVDGNV